MNTVTPDASVARNGLSSENSPYLQQHADNPVHWMPWGQAPFDRARREDKPIFLSVGYSTCHWCHVMAHESFEDEEVAAALNRDFVCIKLDRERRPDVDELYMNATQLLTGRGGWPNSVWLTPDLRPWYAGTYYPKDRFLLLLERLASAWQERRQEIEEAADSLRQALDRVAQAQAAPDAGSVGRPPLDAAFAEFANRFDSRYGGFEGAPKFPPHSALRFLLNRAEKGNRDALNMAVKTLDAMVAGGIHDHVGGGFHRYSTDEQWHLPHFEKMLYDNAQILRNLAHAYRLTRKPAYRAAAHGLVRWLDEDLTHPQGAFFSALDADSAGEEGTFYLWTMQEVNTLLGRDAATFQRLYGMESGGNFTDEATGQRTGSNVLHRVPADTPPSIDERAQWLSTLRRHRAGRVRPALDDKILTAWNALAITALVEASQAFDAPGMVRRAVRAAGHLWRLSRPDGRLKRNLRNGTAEIEALLDDYAFFLEALLALHEATGQERYLVWALTLETEMTGRLYDGQHGGFWSSGAARGHLLVRTRGAHDRVLPSGNAVALSAMVRLQEVTPDPDRADRIRDTIRALAGSVRAALAAATTLLLAWDRAGASAMEGPIRVRAVLTNAPEGEGNGMLEVRVKMDPGWRLPAPGTETEGPASSLEVAAPAGVVVGETTWPAADTERNGEPPVYTKPLLLRIPLRFADSANRSGEAVSVTLRTQPCTTERCLPPMELRAQATVNRMP